MRNITRKPITRKEVSAEVRKLYGDPYIKNRKGIFEFILGGSADTKLLRFGFLMMQPKNQYIGNKQLKLKRKKSQIVRFVLLGMMPIKKKFGV